MVLIVWERSSNLHQEALQTPFTSINLLTLLKKRAKAGYWLLLLVITGLLLICWLSVTVNANTV